jgi:hypothetical protein
MIESRSEIFIFVHIPKSGGSTFAAILKKNFGKAFIYDDFALPSKKLRLDSQDILDLLRLRPTLRAYGSHQVSLDIPWDEFDANVIAICFIRNPIDRFVSHYYFSKNGTSHFTRNGTSRFSPMAEVMSLAEYADVFFSGKLLVPAPTVHTDFIANQSGFLLPSAEKGEAFNIIEARVKSKNLYFFPLERFQEACVFLEHKFPDYFKDCSFVRDEATRESRPQISPDLKDRIADELSEDFKLYQLALDSTEKLLMENFSPQELADKIKDLEKRSSRWRLKHSIRKKLKKTVGPLVRFLT